MLYWIIGIGALIIGSFLNVLIYRLPLMLERQARDECEALLKHPPSKALKRVNLWLPRSFCPTCHAPIAWFSNLPLVSYCLQKGKCLSCHHTISIQYFLIESGSLGLSLIAAWFFGFHVTLVFVLLYLGFALPMAMIDLQHHLLPDELTIGLLWAGLTSNLFDTFCALPDAVIGAMIAYLSLWVVSQIFFLFTGKVGMGQGDIKLFAALGAWFGWQALPALLLIASCTGLCMGVIYLKYTGKSRQTPIPFGPFLVLAGAIQLVW